VNTKLKDLKANPKAVAEKKKSKGFASAMKMNTQKNLTKVRTKSPFLSKKKTKRLKHNLT
jgi:hypothetical protein